MYTKLMFMNYLRQSYAFNFICIYGLLTLLLLLFLFIIGLLLKISFFGLFLLSDVIGMLGIIILLLCILIFIFEQILSIKISNQNFLSNKVITVLQNIGIIVFVLNVTVDLIFFGQKYIEIFYNFNL